MANQLIIKIEGMRCQHCVKSIEEALGKAAGVESVTVDLPKGEALVLGNPDKDALISLIDDLGFKAG